MYDVVVIGLGGVGSFALRALAKELGGTGRKILGIERFQLQHTKGSSHGETRIYRRAYFEDERYIPWIDYSIQEFMTLGNEAGFSLLHNCGTLIIQDKPKMADNAKGEKQQENYIQMAMDSAKKHGIEVEYLDHSVLTERYSQFHYYDDLEYIGLLEPGGGFVRPEMATKAALYQAEMTDEVTILENSEVREIKEIPQSDTSTTTSRPLVELTICTAKETITITAKSVLIAAGAWTSQLIPSWSDNLSVTRQVQGWVDVSGSNDPSQYSPEKFPTWFLSTRNYHLPFFGAPVASTENGNQYAKVGIHNQSINIVDDPSLNPLEFSEAELEEYQRAVKVAIEKSAWSSASLSEQIKVKPCMYTMTPDEHFLIGSPKEFQSVFAVAGLSGHGYKMTPALGQMLADYSLIGEEGVNAKWKPHQFCSPNRFEKSD